VLRHPIPSWRVLGHSDVASARKEDPANCFPGSSWRKPASACGGHVASDVGAEALTRYGYDPNAPLDKVITAFQRHFRPAKLDGQWDGECAGLLASLLTKRSV